MSLADVHITTGQFLYIMASLLPHYFKRMQTGEQEGVKADAILDLIADIAEYNRFKPPATITVQYITSIDFFTTGQLPRRNIELQFSTDLTGPLLNADQLAHLIFLFARYLGDKIAYLQLNMADEPTLAKLLIGAPTPS